jgi:hypothetical protein
MDTNQIRKEARLNNIVVGGLLASGALAFGVSCYGRQVDLIEYCFKPNNDPQYCTPDKRYLMPAHDFSRVLDDPVTDEDRIIAQKATRLRILPATNPRKWLWGTLSVAFIGTAYGLSKARERKLIEYLPQYRETVKQSWVLNKLNNWQQERRVRLEAFNTDRKRQYAADLDYQLWQFGADRAARSKQLSMLSPEEIAIFQEQAQAQALVQAQQQMQEATGLPQAALPGQSLDEITSPSDKVEGEFVKEAIPEGTDSLHASTTTDLFSEYRRIGQSIIKSMVVSDKSLLIASGTGTGKSTTEQYFLQQFVSRYPQSEIYALLNKNDDLFGVRRSRLVVFSPEALLDMPSDKEARTGLLKQLLAPLYGVYDIFLTRKQKPASERQRLKESNPVRLVLGDWYGTYQELLARLTKDELQGVLSMIRQMITIGRDMGVGLVVDTQSANLDSLGLANDASIRQSLDIFSQGFIYYQDGEEKGELQTIRLMFSNKSICSPEDREAIALTYKALADAIKEGKLKTPIIFTSVGSRPRLGIVAELTDGIATQTNIDWNEVARRLDTQYLRSEFGVIVPEPSEPPSEPLNQSDDKAYSQNTSRFTPLNLTREQVLELIKQLRTAELNQTQIIERLWQVRKGGSAAWKEAYQQFRDLTGE